MCALWKKGNGTLVLERVAVRITGDAATGRTTEVSAEVHVRGMRTARLTHAEIDIAGARWKRRVEGAFVEAPAATRLSVTFDGAWVGDGTFTVFGVDEYAIPIEGSVTLLV